MHKDYGIERHEDYAVISLPRKVFIPNSTGYKMALQELFDEGINNIVVDCSALKMFDTAAMYWTAAFQKRLKERGGSVKFVNVNDSYVKQVFRTIDLRKIVDIEES